MGAGDLSPENTITDADGNVIGIEERPVYVNIKDVSDSSVNDWLHSVQSGMVPGHSIMESFGERYKMDEVASGQDIWLGDADTIPIPPDAGTQMTIVSDNINDTDGGTGVREIEIHYLDANGDEQEEELLMNGTTPVNTVATNIRFIQSMHSEEVGSNGVAEGDIIIYKTGDDTEIYNMIKEGGNMSLTINRMVPRAKTFYLHNWWATEARDKRIAFRIRSTDHHGELYPGVFIFKGTSYLRKSPSPVMPVRAVCPALSIVKISGWSEQADAEGSVGFMGVLVDD